MKKDFSPFKIVGIFWLLLGGVVFISAVFPPTKMGKIVDLIAGGMLLLMGAFFMFLSQKAKE
jgi:hypothetical protein